VTQVFREKYKQRYGEDPDLLATQAYDAFKILGAAIERAGTEPKALRAALAAYHELGAGMRVSTSTPKATDATT